MEEMKKSIIDEKEQKETVIEVTDADFQENVIGKSKEIPIVVDFWAQWCAPCLMLGPILEKAVREYNGKFILAKVNVDESRVTAQKYGISSIPSVKMFKDGNIADEFIGAIPEQMVKEWLEKNLSN